MRKAQQILNGLSGTLLRWMTNQVRNADCIQAYKVFMVVVSPSLINLCVLPAFELDTALYNSPNEYFEYFSKPAVIDEIPEL